VGGKRGRGLTEDVAPHSVVGVREWSSRGAAVADASAQLPESSHLHPLRSRIILCFGDPCELLWSLVVTVECVYVFSDQ
jgi:hypothetical protein